MPVEPGPLRTSVVIHRDTQTSYVAVRGRGAADAVDAVVSADLFVRDGRIVHTFVVDSQGVPVADVAVCVDADECLLRCRGMSGDALAERLRATGLAASVEVLDVASLGIHGPYAWELAVELLGDDVLGLPYHAFCRFADVVCLRASTTGEFGYELVGPASAVDDLEARARAALPRYDGAVVDESVLELAALENGFYLPSLDPLGGFDVRQLQQQWRLGARKTLPCRDAIARGAADETPVLVHAILEHDAVPGAVVRLGGTVVGHVRVVRRSDVLGAYLARLALHPQVALPGVDALDVEGSGRAVTTSVPVLRNRSHYVDPRNHSYHDPESRPATPLVVEGVA